MVNKEVPIRISPSLYQRVRRICKKEYKSVAVLVKELLLEKVNDNLTVRELKILDSESANFHKGKGINWREIKRG